MAEIVPVVSESLEAQVRALLPSQRGFGEDLQASNVITPIIDLTAAAQGTIVPEYQQTAMAFGSITSFDIATTLEDIITTTGFYRVFGTGRLYLGLSGNSGCRFYLSDGSTNKILWGYTKGDTPAFNETFALNFDFVVFLASGQSLIGDCSNGGFLRGSFRQIADVNGNPVNPSGFTPQ